jgi:hypothetical protein
MSNIVKTANGILIDIEAIRAKNENVIALGNMNVNARGDEIKGLVEEPQTRKERMTNYYKLHSVIPTKKNKVKRPNVLVEVPQVAGDEVKE